jgi:anion-transporting  ArsA/GET3 family ATPase
LSHPLQLALATKRVLICVGAGGVGKTTTAAALALQAAARGKKALVCTIDPARRLANALGVNELGNDEARLSPDRLREAELPESLRLYAMMLDMKRAWDELIGRFASPEKLGRILANPFYQALSTRLAGSQEYIAMEKLWELRAQRDYDLVVLDTPPTAHAVDFLEAPSRMLEFLESDAAQWLLGPATLAGKVGIKLLNFGQSLATKTISRLTGLDTLQALAGLLGDLRELQAEFQARARGVRELLSAPETAFVLVTTAPEERLEETLRFHALLKERGMQVAALVVNRVHEMPSPAWRSQLEGLEPRLREKLEETLAEQASLAKQDRAGLTVLTRGAGGTPVVPVPRFELDVHDLKGLWRTGLALAGKSAPLA